MSLVFLTKEKEIKKVEKTSSAIFIILIVVMVLFVIGLIYYAVIAEHWGTVVDKYVIEERVAVEYDETLNAEVTITYPARYYIVIECDDGYYKCEVDEFRYVTSSIGKRLQIDSNIPEKIEGAKSKNE